MGSSSLAERLARTMRLTAAEQAALERFEEQERCFKKGATVIRESEPQRELFVVLNGWLHSSTMLGNGSRQIMRFHFRGAILGMPLLAFPDSPETVTAVTDVKLAPFARERFAALVIGQPRLAAAIMALTVAERVSLADRLASNARASARTRVAAVLYEIYMRMRALGMTGGEEMHVPLTQEDLGDATGLTAVHVNRMLRGLAEDRIITRNGSHLSVLDEKRLWKEAHFLDRMRIETDWIPPAG